MAAEEGKPASRSERSLHQRLLDEAEQWAKYGNSLTMSVNLALLLKEAADAVSEQQPSGNALLWNVICMHKQIPVGEEWRAQWRELLASIDQHLTRTGFKQPMKGEDQQGPAERPGQ